jgi:hypothetical protein
MYLPYFKTLSLLLVIITINNSNITLRLIDKWIHLMISFNDLFSLLLTLKKNLIKIKLRDK